MSCCASATDTLASVQRYYGEVLTTTKDLRTNACTAAGRPHDEIVRLLRLVPQPVKDKFYGCGAPLPLGIQGKRVLDLGSGSGRDCYVCAAMVGDGGALARDDIREPMAPRPRSLLAGLCDLGRWRAGLRVHLPHAGAQMPGAAQHSAYVQRMQLRQRGGARPAMHTALHTPTLQAL